MVNTRVNMACGAGRALLAHAGPGAGICCMSVARGAASCCMARMVTSVCPAPSRGSGGCIQCTYSLPSSHAGCSWLRCSKILVIKRVYAPSSWQAFQITPVPVWPIAMLLLCMLLVLHRVCHFDALGASIARC